VCKNLINAYEGFHDLTRLHNLVTGFSSAPDEFRMIGERINNLARLFNNREGFTRKEDSLPVKMMSSHQDEAGPEGMAFDQEELDLMLDEYYEARGWTKNGLPTDQKLKELGLRNYQDM
jgi:aldehyde:ferredoxin oxidoreductase